MSKKLLRFFEYDKIDFTKSYLLVNCDTPFEFDEKYRKAFRNFHSASKKVYYSLENKGIRFCEQVGVIQIHDLVIEVLPKIDRNDTDKDKWHDILLEMLKACKLLQPKSSQDASLRLKSNSILDLYFQKYIDELEYLLHTGLVKKYRKSEGNVKALKGSLQFHKQLQVNLVHAELFFTRHTVYDQSHLLHQVLRQALEVIDHLNLSPALTERIQSLLMDWPVGKPVVVFEQLFKRIVLNRKTEPYKHALSIAHLILMNYHPDIKGGQNQVMALLFNMNNLWEEFMYQRLKYAGQKFGWEVQAQKGLTYWKSNDGGKRLIPDILIKNLLTEKRIVIDTKWKRPVANKPDDHDLRQLLAYKLYYYSDQAFLLYPGNVWKKTSGSYNSIGFKSENTVFKLGMGLDGGLLFASVLENNRLQKRDNFLNSELVMHLKAALGEGE